MLSLLVCLLQLISANPGYKYVGTQTDRSKYQWAPPGFTKVYPTPEPKPVQRTNWAKYLPFLTPKPDKVTFRDIDLKGAEFVAITKGDEYRKVIAKPGEKIQIGRPEPPCPGDNITTTIMPNTTVRPPPPTTTESPSKLHLLCNSCGSYNPKERGMITSFLDVESAQDCANLCANNKVKGKACDVWEYHGEWRNKQCFLLCFDNPPSCRKDLLMGGRDEFESGTCDHPMLNALSHPAVQRLVRSDEPAVIAYHQLMQDNEAEDDDISKMKVLYSRDPVEPPQNPRQGHTHVHVFTNQHQHHVIHLHTIDSSDDDDDSIIHHIVRLPSPEEDAPMHVIHVSSNDDDDSQHIIHVHNPNDAVLGPNPNTRVHIFANGDEHHVVYAHHEDKPRMIHVFSSQPLDQPEIYPRSETEVATQLTIPDTRWIRVFGVVFGVTMVAFCFSSCSWQRHMKQERLLDDCDEL